MGYVLINLQCVTDVIHCIKYETLYGRCNMTDNLVGKVVRDQDNKPCLYIDQNGSLQEIKVKPRVSATLHNEETISSKLIKYTLMTLAMVLMGALFSVVLLEWLVGCGEVTYFADGTWKSNECLFQDRPITTGTWK